VLITRQDNYLDELLSAIKAVGRYGQVISLSSGRKQIQNRIRICRNRQVHDRRTSKNPKVSFSGRTPAVTGKEKELVTLTGL
jgi:hypothetical protein